MAESDGDNSSSELKTDLRCFLCDSSGANQLTIHNTVSIFGEQSPILPGGNLPELITLLINKQLLENEVHSNIICMKCFKLLQEYNELQNRMEEIKQEVLSEYSRTICNHDTSIESETVSEIVNSETEEKVTPDKKTEKAEEAQMRVALSPKVSLASLPQAKVSPMPPNVVIIHKGRKLAIKKTNGRLPTVGKINIKKEVPIVITKLSSKEEKKEILTYDSKTTESSKETLKTVNDGKIFPVLIPIKEEVPQKETEHDEDANDDEQEDMEEMEVCDYNGLEVDESADKEDGENDNHGVINVIRTSTKSLLHGSNNHIMFRGHDGKEIALLLTSGSAQDEQFLERDDEDHQQAAEDIDCQDSNEQSQIELQISNSSSSRRIIRLTTDEGINYIKFEPGADLSKVLGNIHKDKLASFDTPIAERNGDMYTCGLCSSNTGDNDDRDDTDNSKSETGFVGTGSAISIHMRRIHSLRVHVCDVCGDLLKKRAEYIIHLERHLSEDSNASVPQTKRHRCPLCDRTFPTLSTFKLHRKALHVVSSRRDVDRDAIKHHQCSVCGKKYSSKNLLEEHMNVHTGVRPYECVSCLKTFASKYTYHAHLKTHTDRPRAFSCSRCPKAFYTVQNLHQHEKTHSGIKEFVCKICGKAFGTSHNLIVHGVVHSGHKPHVCSTCGKAFARRAEIRDHIRTHTGERPYACDMCSSSFSQRSNLQSHKRATHLDDKRYGCQHCDKRFKRRRLLEYHVKASHTGERPYRCEVCSATFVYPEHFKKHRRIHSGEKPYTCEVCSKSFNSRDNRNAHRFIHSDKKPYECLTCGAGFMRKPLLYAHMNAQGHVSDTIVVNQPRVAAGRLRHGFNIQAASLLEDNSLDNTADAEQATMVTIKTDQEHEEEIALGGELGANTKMLIAGEHFIIQDGDSERIYTTEVVGDDDDLTARQLIFTTPQGDELEKATLSLVHGTIDDDSEMLSLVSKQEADDDPSPDLVVQESEDSYTHAELDSDQIEILTDEDGHVITTTGENGLIRLVQVRLPNGSKGWVALDS